MSSNHTPKGPFPHIIRWAMGFGGFVCLPQSDSGALPPWVFATRTDPANRYRPFERDNALYGNVDWVSSDEKVRLSWHGPVGRYFGTGDNDTLAADRVNIYSRLKLLATAPTNYAWPNSSDVAVAGAAQMVVDNVRYLVAAVVSGGAHHFFRRPWRTSYPNSAIYDADTNPLGWTLIDTYMPSAQPQNNPLGRAPVLWCFDSTGTLAIWTCEVSKVSPYAHVVSAKAVATVGLDSVAVVVTEYDPPPRWTGTLDITETVLKSHVNNGVVDAYFEMPDLMSTPDFVIDDLGAVVNPTEAGQISDYWVANWSDYVRDNYPQFYNDTTGGPNKYVFYDISDDAATVAQYYEDFAAFADTFYLTYLPTIVPEYDYVSLGRETGTRTWMDAGITHTNKYIWDKYEIRTQADPYEVIHTSEEWGYVETYSVTITWQATVAVDASAVYDGSWLVAADYIGQAEQLLTAELSGSLDADSVTITTDEGTLNRTFNKTDDATSKYAPEDWPASYINNLPFVSDSGFPAIGDPSLIFESGSITMVLKKNGATLTDYYLFDKSNNTSVENYADTLTADWLLFADLRRNLYAMIEFDATPYNDKTQYDVDLVVLDPSEQNRTQIRTAFSDTSKTWTGLALYDWHVTSGETPDATYTDRTNVSGTTVNLIFMPRVYDPFEGNAAALPDSLLFYSIRFDDANSAASHHYYLTQGDPVALSGLGGANPKFYPLGVV